MTKRRWTTWLAALAFAMLAALALFLLSPRAREERTPPRDLVGRVRWLAAHPADWYIAAQISHAALESPSPQRFELWRAAHEHAMRLAPRRPNATAAFVRAGLFHWYELTEPDRKAVLANAEPMLRDPHLFSDVHVALYQLTGDLAVLRRAAEGNESSMQLLQHLAATNGRFDAYRELREAIRRERFARFAAIRDTASPAELFRVVPHRIEATDLPLVKALLDELHERPLDADPKRPDAANALIDFALRHDLAPLDGLEYFTRDPASAGDPYRARLALRLGHDNRAAEIRIATNDLDLRAWEQFEREHSGARHVANTRWLGLCGTDVCTAGTREIDGGMKLTVAPVQSDEVPAYVEVFVDDRLVGEGEIVEPRRFAIDVTPGVHRLDVRVVNPTTRNLIQRRVRLSSAL